MNKSILFLGIFLLFPLPSLHANDLAERVSLLERQLALAQATNFNKSSWQTKAFAAKAAFAILAVCTIKRYFMPAESTYIKSRVQEIQNRDPKGTYNPSPEAMQGNILETTIDRIGDIGLFLLRTSINLSKMSLGFAARSLLGS